MAMLGAGAWLRKKIFVWIVAPDGAMDVVCYCLSSSKLGTDIINHHPGDKISSTIQSNYKIASSQLCTKSQHLPLILHKMTPSAKESGVFLCVLPKISQK